MIGPIDAWTLRRLMTGHALNGELQALSEPFRPLAGHLSALPLEARQGAWEGFLCGRADGDALILAMANADPDGPPPEADGRGGDWPPLRFAGLPGVDPFPVDVLPEPAAQLVVEGAKAIGCQPDFLGVPVLAVAAGAIGRSVSLLMKAGYFAGATLFAACIGPPSDGKTPALKPSPPRCGGSTRPWKRSTPRPSNAGRKRRTGPARTGRSRSRRRPQAPADRRRRHHDGDPPGHPGRQPARPRHGPRRADRAPLQGLNQYKSGGKGNDRANRLKIWSGDAIKKDRVGNEDNVPIRCPHPSLSILGGLTPGMLGELLDPKGRADGFIDRFLLAYPEVLPIPPWSERGIPEDVAEDWRDARGPAVGTAR